MNTTQTKPTLKISRSEIEAHIRRGNNCDGHYVLAVAPDGSASRIHWAAKQAQWDPWPDGWLTISIPPLDEDGYSTESERAEDLLRDHVVDFDELIERLKDQDKALVEYVEESFADAWRDYNAEAVRFLADAFLWACNGDGNDLNEEEPWGIEGDYGENITILPPAEFDWA